MVLGWVPETVQEMVLVMVPETGLVKVLGLVQEMDRGKVRATALGLAQETGLAMALVTVLD